MTTNLDVDLRELFVMPHGLTRPLRQQRGEVESTAVPALMQLVEARRFFGGRETDGEPPRPVIKLCVEGLLHYWDQRRGIRSVFGLEEKLRACREVALAMQADDRAEYEADKVQTIFAQVLGDTARARTLLEHIRYRTGLLLERRPGVFAFAHLTFQEYLAARAVHEGNRRGIDAGRLAQEHDDGRWQEVIALYCGSTPAPATRDMIERLIAQPDTRSLSAALAKAYLASGPELAQDLDFRRRVLERIALARSTNPSGRSSLDRFSPDEVAPIANRYVGRIENVFSSEAYWWLRDHPERLDTVSLGERLRGWRSMTPAQTAELIVLLHAYGPDSLLTEMAMDADMYTAPGPKFSHGEAYDSQAEIALSGLFLRGIKEGLHSRGVDAALLRILHTLLDAEAVSFASRLYAAVVFDHARKAGPPQDAKTWPDFASLARQLAERLARLKDRHLETSAAIRALHAWANSLEHAIAARAKPQTNLRSRPRARTTTRRTTKNNPPRGNAP